MRGFSLVETVTALVVLSCVLLSLAPLVTLSANANRTARDLTTATLLALDKIEDLRARGAAAASPSDALDRNAPGFCDFFDAAGSALGGGGGGTPAGAAFVRRWSVALSGTPPDQATIQVAVIPQISASPVRTGPARHRDEVRLGALIGTGP